VRTLFLLAGTALGFAVAGGDAACDDRDVPLLMPGLDPDRKVPTLQQVLGRGWGDEPASAAEVERYLRALAEAGEFRCRLEEYGRAYEGRPLHYLVISNANHIQRLDEVREANLRLADPRQVKTDEALRLIGELPVLVWLAYTVHGNEASGSDAALLTAYHLLADQRPETRKLLDELVVVIDPLQNPDGRDRFVQSFRSQRGVFAQPEPVASERVEPWPSGRFNHYGFDLNRDWFLQSQAETQAKVAAYLRWRPQVFVDAHEMGRNQTYFFAPPAPPMNPWILPLQSRWFERLGRKHAQRFDEAGFAYATREVFDSFYPGYGETWPCLQGAIGILWEQAGVRGTVVERDDGTQLRHRDAVRRHYTSGLATLEAAAENRAAIRDDLHRAQVDSVRLGVDGPVQDYFVLGGERPFRALGLAQLLDRNGIEVEELKADLEVKAQSVIDGSLSERRVPQGSFRVRVAQPGGRLARALLDRHSDMGAEFVRRQLERKAKRFDDEIYDVTAWSLPLAFNVECLASGAAFEVESALLRPPARGAAPAPGEAKLAYVVATVDDNSLLALSRWLQEGLRVHVSDEPLKLGETKFARGTLFLRVHENPPAVHAAVVKAAQDFGLAVIAANSGFVSDGAQLGGRHVNWVQPPRVVLVTGEPTSYTSGHIWYLFDQVWRYPTTRVPLGRIEDLEIGRYDVLVLPHGSYSGSDAVPSGWVERLRIWVREGGTLVLVKGAAAWAASEPVKLLGTELVKKPAAKSADTGVKEPKPSGDLPPTPATPVPAPVAASTPPAGSEAGEPPDAVPGAFLNATVDEEHWLAFGSGGALPVFYNSSVAFAPLDPAEGRNVVRLESGEKLLASGFCWPETLRLLEGKSYLVYRSLGKGHIVAFADDPNFRAMFPALQRFFMNAVFFGPGH
jgi:hypothetical protein